MQNSAADEQPSAVSKDKKYCMPIHKYWSFIFIHMINMNNNKRLLYYVLQLTPSWQLTSILKVYYRRSFSSISNFQRRWFQSKKEKKRGFYILFIFTFYCSFFLYNFVLWYSSTKARKSAEKGVAENPEIILRTYEGLKMKLNLNICVCCRYEMCILWPSKSWKGKNRQFISHWILSIYLVYMLVKVSINWTPKDNRTMNFSII